MLGVNYESSDEEDVLSVPEAKVSLVHTARGTPIATNIELAHAPVAAAPLPQELPKPAPQKSSPQLSATVSGPAQGPAVSPLPPDNDVENDVPPGSPYTSSRATIQNLTLPTVPNFDIPPSPPGSPPQRATKKFAQFLELKKKGQHFNQRLETSSVLRDPGHSQRLMEFAGINEEEQYASTLPEDLAVPAVFPPWAYVEELRASQKRIFKAREQQKSSTPREAIDFVSATKSSAGKRKDLEHRSREVSPKRRR